MPFGSSFPVPPPRRIGFFNILRRGPFVTLRRVGPCTFPPAGPPAPCDIDFTPPVVASFTPPSGSIVPGPRPTFTVTFNEPVKNVQPCNMRLLVGGVPVAAQVVLAPDRLSATVTPLVDLCVPPAGATAVELVVGTPPGQFCPGILDDCGNRLIQASALYTVTCVA